MRDHRVVNAQIKSLSFYFISKFSHIPTNKSYFSFRPASLILVILPLWITIIIFTNAHQGGTNPLYLMYARKGLDFTFQNHSIVMYYSSTLSFSFWASMIFPKKLTVILNTYYICIYVHTYVCVY